MYLASLLWIVESKGMLVRHDDHAEDSPFCRAVLLARLRLLVESHEDSTSRLHDVVTGIVLFVAATGCSTVTMWLYIRRKG